MSLIRTILKAVGLADAQMESAVDGARERAAFVMSEKGIRDATAELQRHQASLGAFDGHIVGLTRQVDEMVDQKAELDRQAEEYAALIKLGGEGVDEATQALAGVLAELEELKGELAERNRDLDDAKLEYESVLEEVREIDEFLDKADKDLQSDEAKLGMLAARRTAGQIKSQLKASLGDPNSAIAELKQATANRKKLIDEAVGSARTERRLAEDPQAELKKRVDARIKAQKSTAAVEAFLRTRDEKQAAAAAG